MSAEAAGWVFRHCPFEGATFAVHLAMADSVNDQHNQLFWMSVENTATKARVSERSVQRSLRELEDAGLIRRVKFSTQHSPAVYRFLFPDIDVRYESRSGGDTVSPLESGVTPATPRGDKSDAQGRHSGTLTQENPKEPKSQPSRTYQGTIRTAEELAELDADVSERVPVEKVTELKRKLRPPRDAETEGARA